MADELLAALDEMGLIPSRGVLRTEAHRVGIWHRSVSIFCISNDGKILVEQRSAHKDLFPGFYDLPGGHVKFGQTAEATAREEILEELQLKLVSPLIPLCAEDAIIEHFALPEKHILNFERKTVYLIKLMDCEESAIRSCAAELALLTPKDLEERGPSGEVSRIEFWSWERLNEANASNDNPLTSYYQISTGQFRNSRAGSVRMPTLRVRKEVVVVHIKPLVDLR